jgi:hypothetical protein
MFYTIGTKMIKIFYLWATYFLGFYINFLFFLNKLDGEDMKFIRGLFLLNVGTVSIFIFLHTLRFKKVLSPKLTFSLYLVHIYLTFVRIPFFCRMLKLYVGFIGHALQYDKEQEGPYSLVRDDALFIGVYGD